MSVEPAGSEALHAPRLSERDLKIAQDPAFAKAIELVRFWRDPATAALLPLSLIAIGGFVAIAFGWRAAARTVAVPLQTPALISGGFGGLALVAIACLVGSIHFSRGDAARERAEIDDLIQEARSLLDVAPQLRAAVKPAAKPVAAPVAPVKAATKSAPARSAPAKRTPVSASKRTPSKRPARTRQPQP